MQKWQGHGVLALLGVIMLLVAYAQRPVGWEYKVEMINDGNWQQANFLGGQGWEIVTARRALATEGALGTFKETAGTELILRRRR